MILLTGATGFLGSNLLRHLINHGMKVCCVKRKTSDLNRVIDIVDKCQWYDLETVKIEQIFRNNQIQMVIHCATNYGRFASDYFKVYRTNVFFPMELLESAIKYRCKFFINTDTFSVREIDCLWKNGEKPYKGAYTVTKYLFANIVREQIEHWEISFLNFQLEHLYGPDDSEYKFVNYIIKQFMDNVEEIELTDGIQARDWIFLDDVLEAYMTVVQHAEQFKSRMFHQIEVGTGEVKSVRQFVETAKKLTNSRTKLLFGKKQRGQSELLTSCADNKILKSFGWTPKYSIEEGIRKIIQH